MHTENVPPTSVFFFAHQDDEFGVFFQIEQELQTGRKVHCIFITDGGASADPDRRNAESVTVLQKLGVSRESIFFIGQAQGFSDGALHESLDDLTDWIKSYLGNNLNIYKCFVPAWEGGHPDHDVLHAAVLFCFAERKWLEKLRQYSLYNNFNRPNPLFRVMYPLSQNGTVEYKSVPLSDRLRYVRLCLSYPSQWKTWIGLFPFAFAHYICNGVQALQHVNINRLTLKPHSGRLYYECRKTLNWTTMQSVVRSLHKIFPNVQIDQDQS